jgi:hypothetical protein
LAIEQSVGSDLASRPGLHRWQTEPTAEIERVDIDIKLVAERTEAATQTLDRPPIYADVS